MTYRDKLDVHLRFWQGKAPCLILIPPADRVLYDVENYRAKFSEPRLMYDSELHRVEPVRDWPTDGIPTIRPNLGTIFIPAIAGQNYMVQDGQMPWPGDPLDAEALGAARKVDVRQTEIFELARLFFEIHQAESPADLVAYHPDTQGVFDIAHLLRGDAVFTELFGGLEDPAIRELMETSLDLFVRVTREIKQILGEDTGTMIHGHGTEQGVFFPQGGTRISEDTATLLSPAMIDDIVMPYVKRSLEAFGGGFVHYCGRSEHLFNALCAEPLARAIDLGNPEMYDTRWLLERCAKTSTVLYSRVAVENDANPQAYIERIGRLVNDTGARCILRPLAIPASRDEAQAMHELWHELTAP